LPSQTPLLDKINVPDDLRQLPPEQLRQPPMSCGGEMIAPSR